MEAQVESLDWAGAAEEEEKGRTSTVFPGLSSSLITSWSTRRMDLRSRLKYSNRFSLRFPESRMNMWSKLNCTGYAKEEMGELVCEQEEEAGQLQCQRQRQHCAACGRHC